MSENKIVERIELNTEEGKYIKCNHCGRLSPEQKYCKYCFNQLLEGGGGSEVRQIYISRGKSYSPVSDYSRMREKIDSEFTTSDINFEALGLTEEEYNLKYTPPVSKSGRDEYKAEVSEKFDEAYRRYEKQAVEAHKARQEKSEAARAEKESVKQIISDTPSQIVFGAAKKEEAETEAPETAQAAKRENENIYTVRRESARFKLSFLSFTCFAMSLLIIATLFIGVLPGTFGMDIISLIPSSLGLEISPNAYLLAAEGEFALIISSGAYLLIAALNMYQFLSFSVCVLLDKKQKNYIGFVLAFTSMLAGVVMLFTLLIGGYALTDFMAGAVILFVAVIAQFICATGKLLKE